VPEHLLNDFRVGAGRDRGRRVSADASGRAFGSFFDRMAWPDRELRMLLRNRSGYVSIAPQDIAELTDRWRTVYQREPTA
jgi:hypothetical protein